MEEEDVGEWRTTSVSGGGCQCVEEDVSEWRRTSVSGGRRQ